MSMAGWLPGEGPRDKLLERGAQALSDAELLAVLLHTGYRDCSALDMARNLLIEFGGLRGGHKQVVDVEVATDAAPSVVVGVSSTEESFAPAGGGEQAQREQRCDASEHVSSSSRRRIHCGRRLPAN